MIKTHAQQNYEAREAFEDFLATCSRSDYELMLQMPESFTLCEVKI